jgi:hypothetical protein
LTHDGVKRQSFQWFELNALGIARDAIACEPPALSLEVGLPGVLAIMRPTVHTLGKARLYSWQNGTSLANTFSLSRLG